MGQRLVVTIHAFDDDIATVYYHWGAYTSCSLEIAKEFIKDISWGDCVSKEEVILRVIRYLEANGGGIDSDKSNIEAVQKMFPIEKFETENISRNNGLIAISETAMEDQMKDACGELVIDYDEQTIYNNSYNFYESIEEFIECEGEDEIPDGGFLEIKINPTEFGFEDIDEVDKEIHSGSTFYKYSDGLIGPEE